jgi:alpha/beta superfamily hydrolase
VTAVLALAGALAPWSVWGWSVLVAVGAVAVALAMRPSRRRRGLALAAALAVVVIVVIRIAATGRAGAPAHMLTLPGAGSSRWLGRLVDEQDVSLAGVRVLTWRWPLIREERATLPRAMRAAYVDMRADLGLTPSPVLGTLLGRQRSDAFDAIVVARAGDTPAESAVVFLHGFAGSFTLECWLVARAADAIGALTVCPATGFSGRWSDHDGDRTLRATIDFLHDRNIRRVYLAGLSNGAAGAAALASRYRTWFAGLILIAGAPAVSTAPGVPALVVHGDRDPMASARAARAYATQHHVRYAGFDAGHFVLLTHRDEVRATIADWLRATDAARAR